jgi:PAS domain S-box-containing protein
LDVATNDELEDLAKEFSTMASTIVDQRRRLESLVTERTKALGEMAAEMSGILENSADAIVGIDSQGRIRVWNNGARTMFGYPLDKAIGRHIDDVILPDGDQFRSEAEFIWSRLGEGRVLSNYQTRRIDRGGRIFPVSMTQTPIRDDQGRHIGYSLIIRDTSSQEKLEEQMRRSERLATVSVLTGGLAHELGNPLTVIVNRLEWMRRKALQTTDETVLDDLGILDKNVARLDSLIRDFLESSREEPDEIQPVHLNTIAESVIGLLERSHRARGIHLVTDLESGLPSFDGSEQAVETVCTNLVLNALDATPQGGTVTVRTRLADEDRVELAVVDTGCGVPEEFRTRVFEPFFTTKRSGEGTGLGLAVCRAIVDKHGGSIAIKSEPEAGSQFVASFPICRVQGPWTGPKYS